VTPVASAGVTDADRGGYTVLTIASMTIGRLR
jgi:hypothetical protein